MKKIAATDRMARLVAAIPWIVAQDGASVDEIAERFDYPRDVLLADLQDVVFYVGVPPYTPDTLIEVTIDDDEVWIRYADWFSRPMRLSGSEILALLTAGETALAFDTQDEAGALARGLTKLRLATGSDSDIVDVQLGVATETILPALRSAAEGERCVDIVYYSFARDERTERRIEPTRFFVDKGNWYVGGHCQMALAERVFRIDRIESFDVTDDVFTTPVLVDDSRAMFSIESAPRAVISVPASRMRLFDGLPIDSTAHEADDRVIVTLPVSSTRWLDQLLIRIGSGVQLLDGTDASIESDLASTLDRVQARYDTRHS